MSRRNVLYGGALALAGAWLARWGFAARPPVSEPDPPVSEVEKSIAQGRGRLRHAWTEAQGLRIHSLAPREPRADAPLLVLVHGSGLSCRYMIPTAHDLANDCRVHVPDLPGFGDSDKRQEVLGVPQLADGLAAWLIAGGLERASLLGNSFGCQVIADLAVRYPQLVAAAVLQGPTTPPDERSWFWQFIRWRQNQRYNPRSLGPITYDDYKKCGLRRMLGSFDSQLTDRIEDKAPRIQAPVLVVRGEHDPIAHQRWCEEIVRLCPNGRLEIIGGVAHTLCYTAPAQLAAVTRAFVRELSDSRTAQSH
jgi:pimeloyl-ACP methyl ester carboxylesterase